MYKSLGQSATSGGDPDTTNGNPNDKKKKRRDLRMAPQNNTFQKNQALVEYRGKKKKKKKKLDLYYSPSLEYLVREVGCSLS